MENRESASPATLDEVIQGGLDLLRENLRLLQAKMASSKGKGFNSRHAAAANSLAKSIAALSAEGRQREKDLRAAAARLTQEEKRSVLLEFFDSMEPSHQRELHQALSARLEGPSA